MQVTMDTYVAKRVFGQYLNYKPRPIDLPFATLEMILNHRGLYGGFPKLVAHVTRLSLDEAHLWCEEITGRTANGLETSCRMYVITFETEGDEEFGCEEFAMLLQYAEQHPELTTSQVREFVRLVEDTFALPRAIDRGE